MIYRLDIRVSDDHSEFLDLGNRKKLYGEQRESLLQRNIVDFNVRISGLNNSRLQHLIDSEIQSIHKLCSPGTIYKEGYDQRSSNNDYSYLQKMPHYNVTRFIAGAALFDFLVYIESEQKKQGKKPEKFNAVEEMMTADNISRLKKVENFEPIKKKIPGWKKGVWGSDSECASFCEALYDLFFFKTMADNDRSTYCKIFARLKYKVDLSNEIGSTKKSLRREIKRENMTRLITSALKS